MRISSFLLGIFILMNAAATTQAKDITIQVNNIEQQRGGNIMVMIFGAAGYPEDHSKAVLIKIKSARRNSMKFEFSVHLPEFAIKVLHDEDGSGAVTKNWTGIIPAEGLGFSNEQKISMSGAPKYTKSKVSTSHVPKTINVKIIYP